MSIKETAVHKTLCVFCLHATWRISCFSLKTTMPSSVKSCQGCFALGLITTMSTYTYAEQREERALSFIFNLLKSLRVLPGAKVHRIYIFLLLLHMLCLSQRVRVCVCMCVIQVVLSAIILPLNSNSTRQLPRLCSTCHSK